MSRSEWQGFGLVVASAAGFGLMAVMARAAYAGGATVPTLLFLRFAVGGAALWAWLAWRRNLPVLSWRIWVALLLMGAAGYAGQSSLYFTALTRIPASLTAMLLYLYPLLVTLLGWLLLRQPISWAQAAALVSSLAGLGLILWQAPPSVRYDPVGVVMGAGAALVYSFYILAGDRLLRRASPLHASAIVMTGAAATFLIAGLATRSLHLSLTLPGWAGVLGLVLFGTLMAILAFLAGLERLGATRASIVSALEPVVTVLSAWALLGESLAARQLLGAGLVLAGALLVQLPSRQVATAAADDHEAVRGGRERNSGRLFAWVPGLSTSVLGWVYRRAERLERRAPATGQEGARTAVRRSAAAEPAGKSPEA
ncbi:MAG: DMT family transporter [Firmicutes bacterium]|nr:DMT family transporter [Bacillota bacterium]